MPVDKKQFERHILDAKSSFEILIRGHLWIENLINQTLTVNMNDPSVLDLDRMGFRQKVDFAQAFGFISKDDGPALRELNRLRNKLAHNLLVEPNEAEIQRLIRLRSEPVKAVFDAVMRVPDVLAQANLGFLELRYWFFSYVVCLDHDCALMKYRRENRVKLMQVAAVRVASEKYAGKKISEKEARHRFELADPPRPFDGWQGIEATEQSEVDAAADRLHQTAP